MTENPNDISREVFEGCLYWFNALSKPISQLNNFGTSLDIDPIGNLIFTVNGEVMFKVSNEGIISMGKGIGAFLDLNALLNDLIFKTLKITTRSNQLQILSSSIMTQGNSVISIPEIDGEMVVKDEDENIEVSGFKSNGFTLSVPTIQGDATIATTSNIPDTGNFVSFDGDETITGIKTFTSMLNLSTLNNTVSGSNLLLPNDSGTLVAKNGVGYIQDTNGFMVGNHSLSVPILTGPDTIATTSSLTFPKFLGYKPSTIAVKALSAINGDWAWNGQTGTKWIYTGSPLSWSDTSESYVFTFPNGIQVYDGSGTLTLPTGSGTLAKTSDIPTDYVKTGAVNQEVQGVKRFTDLRVKGSTDAYIGIEDSWGTRAMSFPKVAGRLMADTDGATLNTSQTFTAQKTFNSGIIVGSGGYLMIRNPGREFMSSTSSSSSTNKFHYLPNTEGELIDENKASTTNPTSVGTASASYGSGTNYARENHRHSIDTSTICTLTGTQTLTNKTLTNPSFNGFTVSNPWYNTTYLNGGGTRYDLGQFHFFVCDTTFKIGVASSTSPINFLDVGANVSGAPAPIFTQCETWYGDKGLYSSWLNATKGYTHTINNVGITAGQRFYMFIFWVKLGT